MSKTAWTTAGCVFTLAGQATAGFADGPAASALFRYPSAVIAYGGNVVVADKDNHRIRLISQGQVTTVAGSGIAGTADGSALSAQFNQPLGIALANPTSTALTLIIADKDNHRIRALEANQVSTLAGSVQGYLDGPVATARFYLPFAVSVAAADTIFVADTYNHRIRRISGGQVTTFAGKGSAGFTDGPLASAQFNFPYGIAVDGAGAIYVADTYNHSVRKISVGQVTTLAGSGKSGFLDGAAASAMFNQPFGIAVNSTGTIVDIADTNNHRIRRIAGGQVSTLAGSGSAGFADGPRLSARFTYPYGVGVDGTGKVYVADAYNHRIRYIIP